MHRCSAVCSYLSKLKTNPRHKDIFIGYSIIFTVVFAFQSITFTKVYHVPKEKVKETIFFFFSISKSVR